MDKTIAVRRFSGPIAAEFQTEACLLISQMWMPREKKATEVVAQTQRRWYLYRLTPLIDRFVPQVAFHCENASATTLIAVSYRQIGAVVA